MSDSEGSISVEQRGPILLIGLNRPAKYNGYTPTMAKQLVEAFTRLDESNDLFVGSTHTKRSLLSASRVQAPTSCLATVGV